MSETRWWWIRHAPVPQCAGLIYGNLDVSCDTSERAKAAGLAEWLPDSAIWVTSSLQRTHQTAEAVLRERPQLAPCERLSDARLGEQFFGEWQGLSHEEVESSRGDSWHRFWAAPAHERPPGGESFEDLLRRATRAIAEITDRYRGRDIVAVTHGGTIRAALAQALGLSPESALSFVIDNYSLTRIDHIAGPSGSGTLEIEDCWRVEGVNFRP